jgi:GAF domain-containing protein
MRDDSATAEAFARLAQELHGEHGVTETVEAVLQFALGAVGCGYAGLVLAGGSGMLRTAAATDPLIELSDQLQLDTGVGPAYAMIADGAEFLLVPDSCQELRWPAWSTGIAQLGLRSVLTVRLAVNGGMLGVLQLFDRRPHAFQPADEEVAHVLARHASVAVASAQDQASLWQAADAHKLVGQAQGILMERLGIDGRQAFGVLRRYSQEHSVRLHEVALLLTETRSLPVDSLVTQ